MSVVLLESSSSVAKVFVIGCDIEIIIVIHFVQD